jgi:hypothetical protein
MIWTLGKFVSSFWMFTVVPKANKSVWLSNKNWTNPKRLKSRLDPLNKFHSSEIVFCKSQKILNPLPKFSYGHQKNCLINVVFGLASQLVHLWKCASKLFHTSSVSISVIIFRYFKFCTEFRAGIFNSCLRSNSIFYLEKQEQVWTSRYNFDLWIPAQRIFLFFSLLGLSPGLFFQDFNHMSSHFNIGKPDKLVQVSGFFFQNSSHDCWCHPWTWKFI